MSRYFSLLRSPYLIAACGIALALICAVIVLSGQLLVKSFDRIEMDLSMGTAARAGRALDADLNQLMVSNRDHAHWDAFYDYLRNREPGFLQAHFARDQLEGLQVDLVWVVAADGRELYSTWLDDTQASAATPAPSWLIDLLRPHRSVALQLAERSPRERFIRTPRGLLAIAASEVTRSDKTHPTGVLVFFGRFIDMDELERVRETSLLTMDLLVKDERGRFGNISDPDTLAWIANPSPRWRVYSRAVSSSEMETYTLLRDVDGSNVAVLVAHRPRDIYALGYRTTWILLSLLLALICSAGAAVMLLFHRLQYSVRAHEAAKYRYTNLAAHLKETIVLAEPHSGKLVEANAAFMLSSGYGTRDLKQLTLNELYPNLQVLDRIATQAGGLDAPSIQECRVRTKDGREIDVEVTVTLVKEQGDEFICVLGRDITARKQAEQQAVDNRRKLSHLANHDPLTGLPNRLFLQTRLPRLLRKLASSERLLAVFYVDVDHFKNVNDLRGHGSGDKLLRIFAKRLKASTGAHDIVVRMGGDEFVVVASLLPDMAAVESIARRLVVTAQAPLILDESTISVSASIGVSVYPNDGIDLESLLKHADIALYQAKENGRNGYKIFTSNMNVAVSEHVALEQALRHAIGTEQLFLEYQPIVNLHTGELESFEALMRWRHPEIGYVPPVRFIPVAEKGGLIVDLGKQALRIVCAQLREWQDQGVPLAPVAVNISPLQLQREPISTLVHELTLEFDIDPKWLHFEITESAIVHQSQEIFVTLQTLRELGSKVSIDDFGTGFSSLSYLKHMPIDTIKIDKAFVQDVVADANDAAIVGGVVSMAKQLKLRTVAEGIETEEQLKRLRELGCVYGQGYYFSRPIERGRCRALLEQLAAARQFTVTAKFRAFGQA